MEHVTTSMDQHGRVLIPSNIREKLNILPGDKVKLSVYENEIRIIAAHQIIDEMHAIFTKNKPKKDSAVDDFINIKREEYKIEEARSIRDA